MNAPQIVVDDEVPVAPLSPRAESVFLSINSLTRSQRVELIYNDLIEYLLQHGWVTRKQWDEFFLAATRKNLFGDLDEPDAK